MADTAWSNGASPDDSWGPATSVRSSSAEEPAPRSGSTRGRRRRPSGAPPPVSLDVDAYAGSPWGPGTVAGARSGTPSSSRSPSSPGTPPASPAAAPLDRGAERAADLYRPAPTADRHTAAQAALTRLRAAVPQTNQRGLPGWAALLVQIAFTVFGILIDALRGVQLGTWFNVGIIVGAVLSILLVRRSGMFPVVVAPPIVYSAAAGASLYIRSGGLKDHNVLIDAATNWLVYGFPAIAAATAAVLIIAGIRLITRR